MNSPQITLPIRVWDLPVRLVHWSLVLLVVSLFVTGKLGGNWLEWHRRAGFSVIGLVIFRVIWGFVGSYHARFANFLRGPQSVITYSKAMIGSNAPKYVGHNPLGALSALTMLIVLLMQAVLGLFSNDDIMLEGPYARFISKELSDQLTAFHKINADLILILVGMHLVAIAFAFFYKKENLVVAMVSGNKWMAEKETVENGKPPAWLAWVVGVCVATLTYMVLKI